MGKRGKVPHHSDGHSDGCVQFEKLHEDGAGSSLRCEANRLDGAS